MLIGASSDPGSPPQVRGKPPSLCKNTQHRRITPAGAGKTCVPTSSRVIPEDHPRRCGENFFQNAGVAKKTGSPPQVRGKPQADCHVFRRQGITPAGAGKTDSSSRYVSSARDHPRRCGENADTPTVPPKIGGSPPQVRGKRRRADWRRQTARITPAGAGKTSETASMP